MSLTAFVFSPAGGRATAAWSDEMKAAAVSTPRPGVATKGEAGRPPGTSRIRRANASLENGFRMKASPGSRTP